ncbi:MAG: hypothetical protein KGI78_02570 [Patescibacteria group bacterium]|nr:hypothetical protein [Patescibacteria group bacterium]MDE1944041.1 hypothetical protein [Patescibacteria group bacterium]MDE1945200.1 hypothetical protein [Patescibacteria group bacterium]MDE2057716.1 hypothetical protein [Patescibacteria group bacterium]
MTIAEARAKGKALVGALWARAEALPKDVLVLAVLVAASLAAFGLGYLAGRDAGESAAPVSIEVTRPEPVAPGATAAAGQGSGAFVASKNGAKYYLPTCSGAKRISDANKVWFASAAAAAAAGYAPAANCPGL